MIIIISFMLLIIILLVYTLSKVKDNKGAVSIQAIHDLVAHIQIYGSTGRTWFQPGEIFNCLTIKKAKELLWIMIQIRNYCGTENLKEFHVPIVIESRGLYGQCTHTYLNEWYRSDLIDLYNKVCEQHKGHVYDIYPYYFHGV